MLENTLPQREGISSTIRCREWFPSFCGRRRGVAAKPPQVTVSCPLGTTKGLSDRPLETFGPPLINNIRTKRQQVAAALSAAVTTTPKQKTAPTSHGHASPKERTSLFPAALREKGSGEEGLLSEKPPPPQNSPPNRLFGREREGGGFSTEKPPPSQIYYTLNSRSA